MRDIGRAVGSLSQGELVTALRSRLAIVAAESASALAPDHMNEPANIDSAEPAGRPNQPSIPLNPGNWFTTYDNSAVALRMEMDWAAGLQANVDRVERVIE